MLTSAALIPAAPLLVPSIVPALPDALVPVRRAVLQALTGPRQAEVVVLVAAGDHTGCHTSAHVDLGGLGRPNVKADLPVPVRASRALLESTGLERVGGRLPVDLAVLALHVDGPLIPVTVDVDAAPDDLAQLGRLIVSGLASAGVRAALVTAGDGSAGLSERSPRPSVGGARGWQDSYEAALAAGDGTRCLERLAGLGPVDARRVAARGWSPAVVFAAACAVEGLRPRTTCRAAPRGIGYVVAEADGVR